MSFTHRSSGQATRARAAALATVALATIATTAALAPSAAFAASEACSTPSATAVDGYLGATFLRLSAQQNPANPRTTWVCFRAADGSGNDRGGRVDITAADVSPQAPTVDQEYQTCTTTPGNTIPPPHPILAGQVGDPSEPPFLPFLLDAYSAAGEAWVCMAAGGIQRRLAVSTGGVSPPAVGLVQDAPATPLPPPEPGPLGYPSSACQAGGGTLVANLDLGDAHLWAYRRTESADRTSVCLRVQKPGAQTVAGKLTVDTNGAPGVTPVLQSSTDTTPCTVTAASASSPVQASLARSPSGANPASVCVTVGATKQRVTVGTTGSPTVPSVEFTKDPDSA